MKLSLTIFVVVGWLLAGAMVAAMLLALVHGAYFASFAAAVVAVGVIVMNTHYTVALKRLL